MDERPTRATERIRYRSGGEGPFDGWLMEGGIFALRDEEDEGCFIDHLPSGQPLFRMANRGNAESLAERCAAKLASCDDPRHFRHGELMTVHMALPPELVNWARFHRDAEAEIDAIPL